MEKIEKMSNIPELIACNFLSLERDLHKCQRYFEPLLYGFNYSKWIVIHSRIVKRRISLYSLRITWYYNVFSPENTEGSNWPPLGV